MLVKLCNCSAKSIEYWVYQVRKKNISSGRKDDKTFSKFCVIKRVMMENKSIINTHEVRWKTELWDLLSFFNYLEQKF